MEQGDQSWVFFGRTDAKPETPVLWPPHEKSWLIGKDPDALGLGAGGEGDDRGWDGWMASLTQWTWVWVNSGSWWWTGRPGVLRFMGLQRVRHDLATELNWTERPVNFIVTSSLENGNILRSVARTMGRYTLKGLCIFHRGSVKIWQVYI